MQVINSLTISTHTFSFIYTHFPALMPDELKACQAMMTVFQSSFVLFVIFDIRRKVHFRLQSPPVHFRLQIASASRGRRR